MSNRPSRPHGGANRPSGPDADRKRVLLIAGAAVVLVVIVGIVLALMNGADETITDDETPAFGPVATSGTPLAPFASTDGDPAVGTAAPVVEGTTPDGDAITIGGAGDEPTVLAFLAHWCPHCQVEVPVIVDLLEAGDLDGVRTVGVLTSTDATRPNFPPVAWLEREDWTGEILLDDDTNEAGTSFGLTGFPMLVFLDADGNVVARTSGEVPAEQILALVDEAR